MSSDAITGIESSIDNYDTRTIIDLYSISDVDTFLSRFNHENNYSDGSISLCLGNTIRLFDGTYNALWQIAGFDVESNRVASDNTTYDNGYGIMLRPNIGVTTGQWNASRRCSL